MNWTTEMPRSILQPSQERTSWTESIDIKPAAGATATGCKRGTPRAKSGWDGFLSRHNLLAKLAESGSSFLRNEANK